ncbi:hypothetical protein [Xylophilus sp. GOD-11R]|uniref:hypothetical protein n=1 Tax=Xylophilus sp. GOD-11R TaxID=3089814 RepID=UPI00298BE799|nr:hypothetical protein [Xylophilus sp. GOD-11R]WPB57378.1 hypothetical protein R9X41_01615 [Xylophilus sp. GOD-11R]
MASSNQSPKTKGLATIKGRPRAPVLTALFPREPTDTTRPQFVRVETYAVQGVAHKTKAGANQKPKASISQVLQEALRSSPEGYRHLTNQGLKPEPPRILFGLEVQELQDWYEKHKARAAENSAAYVVEKTGLMHVRRQDRRWPTLLAEVASFPGPPDETDDHYLLWRERCVARLKRVYGDELLSVIEHTDEPHGHIHALVAHADATPVRALHPGHRASDRLKAKGGTPKEQQDAYKAALKEFQSDFFSLVGRPAGLERIAHVPRQRHSYQQARANKQAEAEYAERVQALIKKEKALQAEATRLTAILVQRQASIDAETETAMQLAYRKATEMAEAKHAKRAKELAEEEARLMEIRRKLDIEIAGLGQVAERVRLMQQRERERYTRLLDALKSEVDTDLFQRIIDVAAAGLGSINAQPSPHPS